MIIMIDHIGRFPSGFDLLTGRGNYWVSAAEGFFIISGLMVGLVRANKEKAKGMFYTTKKLWRRALELYFWTVAVTVVASLVASMLGWVPDTQGVRLYSSFGSLLYDAMTLKYVWWLVDFLPHYSLMMLVAPAVVWLLRRGWWPVVLLGSVGVWTQRTDNFYLAWQLPFMFGMVLGYYLPQLQAGWMRTSAKYRRGVLIGLTASSILTFSINMYVHYFTANAPIAIFDKWTLGPGRVGLSLLWFVTLFMMAEHFYDRGVHRLGHFLEPIGRKSLTIYIVQSSIVFTITALTPPKTGLLTNMGLNAIGVVLIWQIALHGHNVRQVFDRVLSYIQRLKGLILPSPAEHDIFS